MQAGGFFATLRAALSHERRVVGEFFAPMPAPAPLAERLATVLSAVPPDASEVVLWVPGSAEGWVPAELDAALASAARPPAVLVPYEASWRLLSSLEDGVGLLGALLDALSAGPRPRRVLVAGLSQGAWAIARVLAEPGRRNQVARAALFGLPGISRHRPDPADPGCLVVNHPADPVVYPMRRHHEALRAAVDHLASGRLPRALPGLVAVAATHPGWLGVFAWSKLQPWLGRPDPHHYGPDLAAGVTFLLGAAPAGEAFHATENARPA